MSSKEEELRSELLGIGVEPKYHDMVLAIISREAQARAQIVIERSMELVKEISHLEGTISSIR